MSHWDGYPDFWDEFEFKSIIEAIWDAYGEKLDELRGLLRQLDDSKSIFTLPYQIEKRWLRIAFDEGDNVSRPLVGDQLLSIPQLVDDNYVPYQGEFSVDREANAVVLNDAPSAPLKLWAPVYYVHNPLIASFWMHLLGLGDLADRFDRVYNVRPYSGTFYRVVKGLWYVFVSGPSIKNIAVGIGILFNMPVALRPGVISRIETQGMETTIEVTPDEKVGPDFDRWVFSSNLEPVFQVGDRVDSGTSLVSATSQILDYINSPGWWSVYASQSEQAKMELVEKYCTTLIRTSAENYFQDHSVEGVRTSRGFLQEFIDHVLPSYVNMMLALFNSWVDYVEHDDDHTTKIKFRWIDALGKKAECVEPIGEISGEENPFAKHDGELPARGGVLRRNHLSSKDVIYTKGRLFLPDHAIVDKVYLSSGTDVGVLRRGPFWIDIDYDGLEEDVFVDFKTLDYSVVGGEGAWKKRLYVQEWAFAHGYDAKTKLFSMLGEGINQILGIAVPEDPLGPPTRELLEGVDYEVQYHRNNLGEGVIDIVFLGSEEHRELYVDYLAIPCQPVPVDEQGRPSVVDVNDTLSVKLRVADIDDVTYDRGKFYFRDWEVLIGGDLPIYDGEYDHDAEIDLGHERDGHFYVSLLTL